MFKKYNGSVSCKFLINFFIKLDSNSSKFQIFPNELESHVEFSNFKEWLLAFPLYRGKKTGDSTEDENRIVGFFKVST